jgi:hypothetical protein
MTEDYLKTYKAAEQADDDWQAALESRYGSRACDARYDSRGIATLELAKLRQAKIEADNLLSASLNRMRKIEHDKAVLAEISRLKERRQ